ncbi:MAG: hypothetical protein QM687_14995 [Ferruginibacter sp.]
MSASRFLYPFIIIFIVISAAIFALKNTLLQQGFNIDVLLVANALFFVLTLIVFLLQKKSLNSKNPNRLVQAVMGSMLIKMIVVATAVLVYARMAGKELSKISVITGLGFYIIYLVAEVFIINRLNKRPDA